jgi:hypothetical protein
MNHDDEQKTYESQRAIQLAGKISDTGKTFVSDQGGKSWTIINPDAVKGHKGEHILLTANVDADKNEVSRRKEVGYCGLPFEDRWMAYGFLEEEAGDLTVVEPASAAMVISTGEPTLSLTLSPFSSVSMFSIRTSRYSSSGVSTLICTVSA